MTITFPTEPQEEALLAEVARAKGTSPGVLLREALNKVLAETVPEQSSIPVDHRPIWEVMAENMRDVPLEEFDRLPRDGASEHDHYLYGSPKKYR
jgi:hypothetical protein